jgi:rod shape-determining protein MreD
VTSFSLKNWSLNKLNVLLVIKLSRLSSNQRLILNGIIIVGSLLVCLLLLPARLPGMELLGIGPNWLLIWVVSWSMKRNSFQALIAGVALGLIQDGLTSPFPSHIMSLALTAVLTSKLQKQRYIREDFISVALIVFAMAFIAETIIAGQLIIQGLRPAEDIWLDHQRIALASAILSSLWAPVIYYPLNIWWEYLKRIDNNSSLLK